MNNPYVAVFTDEQKQHVKQQWTRLRTELGWRVEHDLGLCEQKKQCNSSAHPKVDVDKMKAALGRVSLKPKVKTVCMNLVKFLDKLEVQ